MMYKLIGFSMIHIHFGVPPSLETLTCGLEINDETTQAFPCVTFPRSTSEEISM